jgi:hypothetical protein
MFGMHMLNDQGKTEVKTFKTEFAQAVKKALDLMPDGRDKSIFNTELEKAVFFGTKAIASKTGNYDSVTEF